MRPSPSPDPKPGAFSPEASTYRGTVAELMRAGTAIPFSQPWYTSIPCTPLDTGMPMGGIGNAFTLTPAGTTPSVSFLNGVHVTPAPGEAFRFRNLFFAERPVDAPLEVADAGGLLNANRYRPLARPDGKPWLAGDESEARLRGIITEMAAHAGLYRENQAALARWRVPLSARTAGLAARGPSPQLSRALLLDVYGGALTLANRFAGALTGDVEEAALAGQPAYPSAQMDHVGLYPCYDTGHVSERHALRVRIEGFTPVIRGEERSGSLPVSVTEVEFENPGSSPLEATLVWTLENLCGDQIVKTRPGVQDAWFTRVRTANFQRGEAFGAPEGGAIGMRLFQAPGAAGGDFDGTMALAMDGDGEEGGFFPSVSPSFSASLETGMVAEALRTGRMSPGHSEVLYFGRERRMGALCATVVVPAGGRRKIAFVLVLDFPHIRLNGFSAEKKYTAYFPDPADRAAAIALETLALRRDYRARIARDHASLDAPDGPAALLRTAPSPEAAARFKTLLCNNLAFIADATVWDAEDHFWVRECADYPFFNSLDVYFYGSFALLRLLPRLDGCILREFARAILAEDPTLRRHWAYSDQPHADLPDPKYQGPRSVAGAVPHDMGSPFDPKPDAYIWHNVKHWKDLAPKFLLMVWRHFRLTGDKSILEDCWPASRAALDYLSAMRAPGESIPLTHGTDDTFDNLASHGVSIYCGSLWVAALTAGAAIAEELGETGLAGEWRTLGARSRRELAETLWDEKEGYYRFYVVPGGGERCEHVFADQLLSDLWLDMLGLEPISTEAMRRRAAGTILERNFRRHSPWIGAANLCGKDGRALEEFQAQDVWVGVQFSLAAACLRAGETGGAWELIETQYRNLYQEARIPFGAPEGFNGSVALTPESLARGLDIPLASAAAWLAALVKAGMLDGAHRPAPASRSGLGDFLAALASASGGVPDRDRSLAEKAHGFLKSHALQYTAGRYLRPGMAWVFAWPFPA